MTQTLRIGFVSLGAASWPDYDGHVKLALGFVKCDLHSLDRLGQSLFEIIGKKQTFVSRVVAFAAENQWRGVILIYYLQSMLEPMTPIRPRLAMRVSSSPRGHQGKRVSLQLTKVCRAVASDPC